MTNHPTLISRDAARRGGLNHLALLRLGQRLRLSEASWTLKTLQSKSGCTEEDQDLGSRREVTGQNPDGTWSHNILLVHEESKEIVPRAPVSLHTEPGPEGSLWATSVWLFSALLPGFPNSSAARDEEKGSLHC